MIDKLKRCKVKKGRGVPKNTCCKTDCMGVWAIKVGREKRKGEVGKGGLWQEEIGMNT